MALFTTRIATLLSSHVYMKMYMYAYISEAGMALLYSFLMYIRRESERERKSEREREGGREREREGERERERERLFKLVAC